LVTFHRRGPAWVAGIIKIKLYCLYFTEDLDNTASISGNNMNIMFAQFDNLTLKLNELG